MNAIQVIQKPENGQLVIDVPDELRDETLVVTFEPLPKEKTDQPPLTDEEVAKRVEIFNQVRGRSKDSTYPYNKYDVYNQ